jgi:hypothetical protein
MKITEQQKALVASYARTAISAGIAVYLAGNHDLKAIGAAAFAAISGPLMRWFNPNDKAFGRGAA